MYNGLLTAFDFHRIAGFFLGFLSVIPTKVRESPCEQAFRLGKSTAGVTRAEDDRYQTEIFLFGGGDDAVACFPVRAGFEAIEAAKPAHETVGIGKDEFSVPKRSPFGLSPLRDDREFQKRSRQFSYVTGACFVGWFSSSGREAVDIDKICVGHPKLPGAFIHDLGEYSRIAGNMFGYGVCGVVRGADGHGFEKVIERKFLPLFQIDLLASYPGSFFRYRNGVPQADGFFLYPFEGDEGGHHLDEGGGDNPLALAKSLENLTGIRLDQQSRAVGP
tara:strand:- start:123 stop:947 length:825 start_codon:yes stop_codon:yes gene_type:complete